MNEERKDLLGALLTAQAAGDRWMEAAALRACERAVRKPDCSHGRSVLERFMARVVFGLSDCWIWTGGICPLGYGRLGRPLSGEVRAHRLAYRLFHGEIPGDLKVMHSCDVRCCVNPAHLSLGTQADNVRDCVQKGRHRTGDVRGEKNPMARLSHEKVADIRALKAQGVTQAAIARRFGVSPMTISRVIRGEAWS